ncbi:MAG TPA: dihydrolipoyl dehydrogenase [Oscillospiraceae bacterium]|nr:dihydrolipoyl dehydrogenase [Oscillospiraceae bacterium]HPF56727.1 dihydrolipoyl dehydrogenase [Clostridiales bacterium]HPK34854.1 dihydrolipoyl dehydrogenase [Oscillospiraceae bacterium]HPR76182.1 dihydrolipoyl dehydrogenase [Oscillospiraceae bacterium]
MDLFDLIVIGGGPGGYLAAERAGHAGLKVALFEKRSLGGVCLNEGCIPSKALLYSAKVFDYANHASAYGVTVKGATIDQNTVIDRKDGVVKTLVSGVGATMKKNHVTVVNAAAVIKGKTADGFEVEADGKSYTGKKLIIAAGSEAVVPPIPGAKEGLAAGYVMTNREILALREIPKALAIIGGGVIGLEMASYFCSVGSKVTVIEMLNKIAGPTDDEISTILQKNYAKKGVDFKLGCKVTGFEKGSVSYTDPEGKAQTLACDYALMSIGRRPSSAGLGLEAIGVYMERGAVKTDDHLLTNVPDVYAVGDINGKLMLAHTAYREAEVAVNHILGKKDTMRYGAIASVIYTNPEVGCVGETEESAKQKGFTVKTAKLPMIYSGRYLAEGGGDGICKIIADAKTNKLLGVHMIGSYCSEIIYGAAQMIESGMKIETLKELVFPHPTVSEIVREVLFEL